MTTLIFTYGYPPSDGGVQFYSAGVAKGFWQQGEQVIVLAPRCNNCRGTDAKQPFPIYRSPSTLVLREAWMLLAIPWLIRKHRVTRILSTVWLPCGIISWLVTRMLWLPYYQSAHGSELLDTQNIKSPLKHFLRRRLGWLKTIALRDAQAIFAVSEHTRQIVLSIGVPPGKVFTVPNGVDTTRFRKLRDNVDRIRTKHSLDGRKIILTVGRLDDYKGHDTVIRALSLILAEVPQATYLVVGRGPERERLARLVEAEGVAGHVVFVGYVTDEEVVDYYNACDVFVLVPRQEEKDVEGFGLVYLEANACGKPVVGGDSGGVRDAIKHGETGVVVDPTDERALAQAVVRLLSDENEAGRLGNNGSTRARNEMDWLHVTRRMRAIVDQVSG